MTIGATSPFTSLNKGIKHRAESARCKLKKMAPSQKTLRKVPIILSKIAAVAMGIFCLIEDERSRSIPLALGLITAGIQDTVTNFAGKKKAMIQKIALFSLALYTYSHEMVMSEFTSGFIVTYSALKGVDFLFRS